MKFTWFVPSISTPAIHALLSPSRERWQSVHCLVSFARTVCGTCVLNALPVKPADEIVGAWLTTQPRVPFGTIIELGILEPGSALTDERGRIRAEVKADGTLAAAGRQGSIHRMGAELQGKTACNGWTFWHYETAGRRQPIDALRSVLRKELAEAGA